VNKDDYTVAQHEGIRLNCLTNIAVLMLKNHFSQRIINAWNNLPSDIDNLYSP